MEHTEERVTTGGVLESDAPEVVLEGRRRRVICPAFSFPRP